MFINLSLFLFIYILLFLSFALLTVLQKVSSYLLLHDHQLSFFFFANCYLSHSIRQPHAGVERSLCPKKKLPKSKMCPCVLCQRLTCFLLRELKVCIISHRRIIFSRTCKVLLHVVLFLSFLYIYRCTL